MTKIFKTLILLALVILMSSFVNTNIDPFIGTYSVSASDPSQITLRINPDHTFYYQDFSIPDKKIVINGNWIQRGNKVVLKENTNDIKFHNVWTFHKSGQVAQSRKGASFYRLCKID